MHLLRPLLGTLLVSAATVSASQQSLNTTRRQSTACKTISALQRQGEKSFPPDVAKDCLTSVPLDVAGDTLQLKGLRALLEFQSGLTYLKSPPSGYFYPAIDLIGSLDELGDKLSSGVYNNDYEFQLDVFDIVRAAHDTHLFYLPDLVDLFVFERQLHGVPYQIFSISEDGLRLPATYSFIDQNTFLLGNASYYTPSPITTIDGQDVESYLNAIATYEPLGVGFTFQDPDAAYNALFPNIPNQAALKDATIIGSLFSRNFTYTGNVTTIGFANGTVQHIPWVATTTHDFTNITSGNDLYTMFCNRTLDLKQLEGILTGSTQPSSNATGSPSTRVPYAPIPTGHVAKSKQLPTYPLPIAFASDDSIAGYFPTSRFLDLAVLAIPTYGPADTIDFENIIREVLATAVSQRKKKLIIDLRGNDGGSIAVLYDTFRELFPSLTPYGATNERASSLLNDIGQSVSAYFDRNDSVALSSSDAVIRGYYNPYDYRLELNAENQAFNSWKELFGPDEAHGDNFTSLLRYNLSDPYSTQESASYVYGYGNNTKAHPQPFDADNIILLQDGTCTSACAVFTELMKSQGQVRQIVVGGRRQIGPMQGVGGTKGAEVFPMIRVVAGLYAAYIDAEPAFQAYLNQTYGGIDGWFVQSSAKAIARGVSVPFPPSLNLRNNIRRGDDTRTPLQFVYEAADCRFFYTAAMYTSQEEVWNRVYELAWANGTCVEGSMGQASSEPGTGYISSPWPSAIRPRKSHHSTQPSTSGTDATMSVAHSSAALLTIICLLFALM